jgi:hypothetical protein
MSYIRDVMATHLDGGILWKQLVIVSLIRSVDSAIVWKLGNSWVWNRLHMYPSPNAANETVRSLGVRSVGVRSVGVRSVGVRSVGVRALGLRALGVRALGMRTHSMGANNSHLG